MGTDNGNLIVLTGDTREMEQVTMEDNSSVGQRPFRSTAETLSFYTEFSTTHNQI